MRKIHSEYDKDAIVQMSLLEAIRTKMGMYYGEDGNGAVFKAIVEIINNSVDEALAGFGSDIEIDLDTESNTISVRDYGRGIPSEKLDKIFTEAHVSGKFNKEGENAVYSASSGTNGTGLKLCSAGGTVFVEVFRPNEYSSNTYRFDSHGELKQIKGNKLPTGTKITWTPDDIFSEANTIYPNKLLAIVSDLSYPIAGVKFHVTIDGEKYLFSSNGVQDFFSSAFEEEDILSPIMTFKDGNETLSVEGALAWTTEPTQEKTYLNYTSTSEGGTHLTALKTVLTRVVNSTLGSDFSGNELRKNLSLILSVKTIEQPVFSGQAKHAVAMPKLNAPLSQMLTPLIKEIVASNKGFFEKMKTAMEKAREKEAAVEQIRQVVNKGKKKANPIPKKLKMALNKKGAELFLTEGLSAGGSLIQTRDPKKHAIMCLRGKPINVIKNDIAKVLKNEEIQDMILAFGGFGEDFNPKDLGYDKIILAADSDEDGKHIEILLMGFLYQFYPQLIEMGKIYVIQAPLYIVKRKDKVFYLYTEKEKSEFKTEKNDVISRLKGLGEIDQRELAGFMFDESTRILHQVKMEDRELIEETLQQLLGQDSEDRKALLFD